MLHALGLAERGRCSTAPNPWVGCVIVGADGAVPRDGIALEAMTLLFNTTFLYVWFCSGGGFFSSLAGARPKLPIVGDVAEQQADR